MKQLPKILKVVLLLTIYCFGLLVSLDSVAYSGSQTIEQNNKEQDYFSNVSKVIYVHTQQSESLLSEFTEYLTINFDFFYKGFWVTLFPSELLFKTKFKQYQNYFQNLLINNRKSDLIFPFHNFW